MSLGAAGALAALLAVYSVTRVVGYPYHYLVLWMAILPVLPLLGVAAGLQGVLPASVRPASRRAAAVVLAVGGVLGLRAVAHTPPAAAHTDRDIARAWALSAPVVGRGHEPVRLVINDGERWPTAAGLGLELERHGHPVRVSAPWTLLFGADRTATGREPITLLVASVDPSAWPDPADATIYAVAGRARLFAARQGPPCWYGWIPFGGPACPFPIGARAMGPPSHPPSG